MPLIIVRNDITTMRVDAIVNAANESLLGGGGVDGCIHRAAGPELLAECRRLGGCRTGEAKLTRGYRLPCKYIIHTVGPVWHGGDHGEQEQLVSCYRTSLALARKHHCQTVAFRSAYQISSRLFADIAAYIDNHYVDAHTDFIRSRPYSDSITDEDVRPTCRAPSAAFPSVPRPLRSLNDRLRHLDAGFSETLLTRIDRSGKKDSEIYKRANVDRKLFSKIRSNPDYRPSKPTALAFAIALELDLTETRDLIARAGYALSRSSKFDVIIEYFISQRNYNIYEINEALFAFDQSLLGA